MNFWILLLVQNITVMRMQTCFIKRNKQFQPNNKDYKTNVPFVRFYSHRNHLSHSGLFYIHQVRDQLAKNGNVPTTFNEEVTHLASTKPYLTSVTRVTSA